MNCAIGTAEHAERLLAYCAHRLEPAQKAEMDAHLAECASCREFVQKQSSVWSALEQWDAPAPGADFDRRLYARIDADSPSWWESLVRPFRLMPFRQGAAVAATVVLLATAGMLARRNPDQAVQAVPPSVAVAPVTPDQVESALAEMETLRQLNQVVSPDPRI